MSSQGDLVILEHQGKRAAVLYKQGNIKLNLTIPGAEVLYSVSGKDQLLYITDLKVHVIHVVMENNTYVTSIATNLMYMAGLCITESTLWVTTAYDGLYKLTIDSKFNIIKSDMYVPSSSTFSVPISVTVQYGRAVVVCQGSNNVHVLDTCGTGARLFPPLGGLGAEEGKLFLPRDVVTDIFGNMYVADDGNGRIVVYSNTGQFMWNIVIYGDIEGQPVSLYLDNNIMYVVTGNPIRLYTLMLVTKLN
jgi:hypothetical protein